MLGADVGDGIHTQSMPIGSTQFCDVTPPMLVLDPEVDMPAVIAEEVQLEQVNDVCVTPLLSKPAQNCEPAMPALLREFTRGVVNIVAHEFAIKVPVGPRTVQPVLSEGPVENVPVRMSSELYATKT